MTKVAIHQPNFIPWFPFFYKMAMADVFVILKEVQFEKNGFQNRCQVKGKWVTKSVQSGTCAISDKKYADGQSLLLLNIDWIHCIKDTLGIKTRIAFDDDISSNNKTDRLIQIVRKYDGDVYITNPEAKNKYLDEDMMWTSGIDIEYCNVPKNLQKHTFEIFEEYGIDGAIKQLPKRKEVLCGI
jgi:hypothetical protein